METAGNTVSEIVPARAVRIVRGAGKPIAQVARDLGINEGTLGNWYAKDRAEREGTDDLIDVHASELTGQERDDRFRDQARLYPGFGG